MRAIWKSTISFGLVSIAKVVIKERQHLAAIKAQQNGLMLELMRFPDEIIEAGDLKAPQSRTASKAQMDMASKLIQKLSKSGVHLN